MFFAQQHLGLFALIVFAGLALSRAVLVACRGGRAGAKTTARTVSRIGRYRVRRKLGEGGMGVVYEACEVKAGERVALKLVRGDVTAKRLDRFESEIRILERVRHQNVVALRDQGVAADGSRYLAMELLDGADLQRVLDKQGALRPRRVLSILSELCEALIAVHAAGVVHRDIKPANVFLCEGGGGHSIKLLDFGLATPASDAAELEGSDEIVGSPYGMAPECFTNPDKAGPAADLYAVGVLAYTLLTGAPPFARGGVIDIAAQHLYAEPPSLRERCPSASAELRAVVASCLEKDAARRPASARVLLQALRSCPEARATELRRRACVDRSLSVRRAGRSRVAQAVAA
jgi:serine/threonine protein kinase